MASNERDEVVVEHIIESRQNALTAFDVASAFPHARQKLVRMTLKRIEERVSEECGIDLRAENSFESKNFDRERHLMLSFRHSSWPDDVSIALTSDDYRAREMSLGLTAPEVDAVALDHVVMELDKVQGRDQKPFPLWPWYYMLPRPYRHWDERDAIAQFFPDDTTARGDSPAVEFLVGGLRNAIVAAHPLLLEVARDGS